MKITGLDAFPFRLPVRRHFRWASLLMPLGGFVYVEIATDEGMIGVGEATPLPDWAGDHGRHGGETQDSVVGMIKRVIEPALVGLDPTRIDAAHAAMDRVLRGNSYARCAVDIALHDLWGKALGQPLHVLLGGLAREQVRIAHMIGIMPPDDAVAEARGAEVDGVTALQIKGGESAARDAATVHAIRKALGPEVFLRLDINQGYGRAKAAARLLAGMADDLDMVEQPVRDLHEMALLTARLPLDVIADESCWDAHDALALVQCGAADAVSIYLAKAGGIAKARRVAAIAETAGLPCDVNGSLESAIGNAANLHFALATPAVSLPCVIPVSAPRGAHKTEIAGRYYEDDIAEEAFAYASGALLPFTRPGLGITIDRPKLERYRER